MYGHISQPQKNIYRQKNSCYTIPMTNHEKNAIGIVAEYNPFHNGHLRQIELVKKSFPGQPIVCVMSGNFVQRGEPAIWDKYVRTRSALICGADMVIELPVAFATASAEYFSHHAVALLDSLGIVEYICFGSETGELLPLQRAAELLVHENAEFRASLKALLDSGHSYPAARHMAIERLAPDIAEVLNAPNNILGIEYLKAIIKLGSDIKPFVIKREGEGYHSTDYTKELSSATAIRAALIAGHKDLAGIPTELRALYSTHIERGDFFELDNLSQILHYIVKTCRVEQLSNTLDVSEGLHNSIIEMCGTHQNISDILKALKSKRYAYTRLSRALLHIILGISKDDFNEFMDGFPHYIRVLGFRKEWECLFTYIDAFTDIPIITNLKNYEALLCPTGRKLLKKEIESSDIYYLCGKTPLPKNSEFSKTIIVV